jgi:hypothetical protein
MTDEELKELVAGLAVEERNLQARMSQTEKMIKELGKQIGGLGEKFGSFTEGMAFPSMQKVLREQFGMDSIATRYKVKQQDRVLELDVFGHTNGTTNKAIIVEVKSHLREEHIEQILQQLRDVKKFLPEHANKRFIGILAVVDSTEYLRQKVLNEGLYYAEIHDDMFQVKVPENFKARVF